MNKTANIKRLFVALSTMMTLIGCSKRQTYLYTSFLDTYFCPSKIELSNFKGNIKFNMSGDYFMFDGKGDEKHFFDSVSTHNADISYNVEKSYTYPGNRAMPINESYAPEFTGIEVISDKVYDANHPAGASLRDCFEVKFKNATNYIVGHYNGKEPEYEVKSLHEMSSGDWHLMYNLYTSLYFTRFPEVEGEYMFEVTITREDGSTLSDRIWLFAERSESGISWNNTKYVTDKYSDK